MEPKDLRRGLERHRLTWFDVCEGWTLLTGNHMTVGIGKHEYQCHIVSLCVLVPHLRLGVYHCLVVGDVEVGGIDIRTRRAEVGIERQRLVELSRDVQPHVLRDAAIVGVEVLVVPLVTAVVTARAIVPTVVAAHGQHVFALFDIGCQVKATSHHTVFAETQMMSVQIEVSPLSNTFELDEYLTLYLFLCQKELLAIPTNGICQIDDVLSESLIAVEGIGESYPLPIFLPVSANKNITDMQSPIGIEIEFLSFKR